MIPFKSFFIEREAPKLLLLLGFVVFFDLPVPGLPGGVPPPFPYFGLVGLEGFFFIDGRMRIIKKWRRIPRSRWRWEETRTTTEGS